MHICENCNTEFEKSLDINSIRFCCEHCRRVWNGKASAKKPTHKNNLDKVQYKNAPAGRWICRKCNIIFRTRAERQKHRKECHPNSVAWNKGLTLATSESLRQAKKTLEEGYKSGRIKPTCLSKEARERLSKSTSAYLESINYESHGRVKWYSCQNILGNVYKCQGLWEYNVAIKLNEMNILWERGKQISYIKNGITKTYNPDFYLPTTNEYLEVKGLYSPECRQKMKLVSEQNPDKIILFIDCWHYNKFINGQLSLDRNVLKLWY